MSRQEETTGNKAMDEVNPIVVPDPPQPVEKRYKVVGMQPVFGHPTGAVFNATLSFQQEEELTTYGHLEVVTEQVEPQENQEVQVPVEEEQSNQGKEDKEQ